MSDPALHDSVLEATGNKARLARVYASALHSAASKANQVDAIGEELTAIAMELAKHTGIALFLSSPAITRKGKWPALQAALANRSSELVKNFLGVLNQNNRLDLLKDIARAYQAIQDTLAGRVRVRVTAAAALSDAQTDALRATLTETLKKKPILTITVDPELLGGLVVQVGDRVYDTSVRTRLNTLRTQLLSSRTHVI